MDSKTVENRLVGLKNFKFWEIMETVKSEELNDKSEKNWLTANQWSRSVYGFFIYQIVVFEFWIENRSVDPSKSNFEF
jgi:hypothetical protein